jgi:hypothetical protein
LFQNERVVNFAHTVLYVGALDAGDGPCTNTHCKHSAAQNKGVLSALGIIRSHTVASQLAVHTTFNAITGWMLKLSKIACIEKHFQVCNTCAP